MRVLTPCEHDSFGIWCAICNRNWPPVLGESTVEPSVKKLLAPTPDPSGVRVGDVCWVTVITCGEPVWRRGVIARRSPDKLYFDVVVEPETARESRELVTHVPCVFVKSVAWTDQHLS